MKSILFAAIMSAVFVFGYFIADRFGKLLDDFLRPYPTGRISRRRRYYWITMGMYGQTELKKTRSDPDPELEEDNGVVYYESDGPDGGITSDRSGLLGIFGTRTGK